MQRKLAKQFGKATQYTKEKVFSTEKTQFSSEFNDFEREVDPKRLAVERLHATSLALFHQLTKVKPTADPYPPSGSAKDKVLHTEALGLVMLDVGGEVGGTFGDGLSKYGTARCRLAAAQQDFTARIGETYVAGMEEGIAVVNEYKTFRKKLDSRRLALDSAITKFQNAKKDQRMLEFDVDAARDRFDEIEEETTARMVVIESLEEGKWSELTDFLDAELEYFSKCKEIMEELRASWPMGAVVTNNRPRAQTMPSRSSSIRDTKKSFGRSRQASDEEEDVTPNRSRSHSTASSLNTRRRSMLPSFGSLRRKSGLGRNDSKRKTFGRKKDRDQDDENDREALESDEEDTMGRSGGKSRLSMSVSAMSLASEPREERPHPRRRQTTPGHLEGHWVKLLFDFPGSARDELSLQAGDLVEVKQQVSEDWWLGECDGHTGLFPTAYCEEYVQAPPTNVPRAPPVRSAIPTFDRVATPEETNGVLSGRSIPPPAPVPVPNPVDLLGQPATSDSELESHGFSDADHWGTASLAMYSQEPSQRNTSPTTLFQPTAPPRTSSRKAPPPPPPSRRSQSYNVLASANFAQPLSAFDRGNFVPSPEAEGSPFAGSEEDEEDEIYRNKPGVGNGRLSFDDTSSDEGGQAIFRSRPSVTAR